MWIANHLYFFPFICLIRMLYDSLSHWDCVPLESLFGMLCPFLSTLGDRDNSGRLLFFNINRWRCLKLLFLGLVGDKASLITRASTRTHHCNRSLAALSGRGLEQICERLPCVLTWGSYDAGGCPIVQRMVLLILMMLLCLMMPGWCNVATRQPLYLQLTVAARCSTLLVLIRLDFLIWLGKFAWAAAASGWMILMVTLRLELPSASALCASTVWV